MDTDESDALEEALTNLLEVPGVEGSLLVDDRGTLCAWNMPDLVELDVLDEVSAKLARVREAFRMAGDELDFCVIRFVHYQLCLKAGQAGTLCVLARPEVNLPALRMAAKLLLHQVGPIGQA